MWIQSTITWGQDHFCSVVMESPDVWLAAQNEQDLTTVRLHLEMLWNINTFSDVLKQPVYWLFWIILKKQYVCVSLWCDHLIKRPNLLHKDLDNYSSQNKPIDSWSPAAKGDNVCAHDCLFVLPSLAVAKYFKTRRQIWMKRSEITYWQMDNFFGVSCFQDGCHKCELSNFYRSRAKLWP